MRESKRREQGEKTGGWPKLCEPHTVRDVDEEAGIPVVLRGRKA